MKNIHYLGIAIVDEMVLQISFLVFSLESLFVLIPYYFEFLSSCIFIRHFYVFGTGLSLSIMAYKLLGGGRIQEPEG